MSVLPPSERPRKKRSRIIALLVLVVLIGAVAYVVWEKLFHEVPQQFASQEERFKYGSIGGENAQGIPYWIWVVLPRVFPENLPGPGGYPSLGLAWEEGRELPVGFSKKRIGYERVAFNCAVCHTATYRTLHDDDDDDQDGHDGRRPSKTVIVPTGPATRFDPQGYLAFLRRCAESPRFNSETLMPAIEYNVKLSWLDRQLYSKLLIPATRKALLKQSQANAWMEQRPVWGHGRIDPFNPVKFGMLGMDAAKDETVGNSDMMPLWEMNKREARTGYHLHWDGLSTLPLDAALAGALGDGATRKSLPVEQIEAMTEWLGRFRPSSTDPDPFVPNDLMRYPPPRDGGARIDEEKANRGKVIFNDHCADCHARGGTRYNTVIRLDDPTAPGVLGTDPNRLQMWNPPPRDPPQPFERYNRFADGYSWDLNTFVATAGYVAVPLNGIWLRAPYLHNGSVPTLEDLLNPPMDEKLVADFLDAAGAGTFARLERSLSQAGPPAMPADRQVAELERLKKLVDELIKVAREKERRPPMFYRGCDVLDPSLVGFVHTSEATEGRNLAIPFATFVKGNSNAGHLYGVDLTPAQKSELVEYLKSL